MHVHHAYLNIAQNIRVFILHTQTDRAGAVVGDFLNLRESTSTVTCQNYWQFPGFPQTIFRGIFLLKWADFNFLSDIKRLQCTGKNRNRGQGWAALLELLEQICARKTGSAKYIILSVPLTRGGHATTLSRYNVTMFLGHKNCWLLQNVYIRCGYCIYTP